MKLYYIDDSLFQRSQFSQQTLFRFGRYFRHSGKGIIFISTNSKDNSRIEYFCEAMPNTMVLSSPSEFEIDGIRGNLHSSFLSVENFPLMRSYSGSCVAYDTEKKTCERIYLDMFINHDEDMDDMIQEMEQMLNEKIQLIKKKIILN